MKNLLAAGLMAVCLNVANANEQTAISVHEFPEWKDYFLDASPKELAPLEALIKETHFEIEMVIDRDITGDKKAERISVGRVFISQNSKQAYLKDMQRFGFSTEGTRRFLLLTTPGSKPVQIMYANWAFYGPDKGLKMGDPLDGVTFTKDGFIAYYHAGDKQRWRLNEYWQFDAKLKDFKLIKTEQLSYPQFADHEKMMPSVTLEKDLKGQTLSKMTRPSTP